MRPSGRNQISAVAAAHFAAKNQKIELIQLNGSVELAPIVGLSDVIADIVETGNTLKANGLEVIEADHGYQREGSPISLSYAFKRNDHQAYGPKTVKRTGAGGVMITIYDLATESEQVLRRLEQADMNEASIRSDESDLSQTSKTKAIALQRYTEMFDGIA